MSPQDKIVTEAFAEAYEKAVDGLKKLGIKGQIPEEEIVIGSFLNILSFAIMDQFGMESFDNYINFIKQKFLIKNTK